MNDVRGHQHGHDSAGSLELRKLELEVADAEFRQATVRGKEKFEREKEKLELEKLEQEIFEKKLLNEHKKKMDVFEAQKAELEIKEKELATKRATVSWDIVKYGVAVLPVLATLVGLYLTYRKDTEASRHQVELEQKFKVDKQVIELFKAVADSKNSQEAIVAAELLPAYGRVATRVIVPQLKVHPDWSTPFLIAPLRDVVANEPGEPKKKREAADELIQRFADEIDLAVKALLPDPKNKPKSVAVRVYVNGLVRLHQFCAPACVPLNAALNNGSQRILNLLSALDVKRNELDKELLDSVEALKQVLVTVNRVRWYHLW